MSAIDGPQGGDRGTKGRGPETTTGGNATRGWQDEIFVQLRPTRVSRGVDASTAVLERPVVASSEGAGAPPPDDGGGNDDGGERHFSPEEEDDLRRSGLFRLGLCMTVAFFAPIVGFPGQTLLFPELSGEVGVFAAGQPWLVLAVRLLPLIAGIAMMALARRASPPLRGAIVTGIGASVFLLFLADGAARSVIGQMASAAPTSVSLSLLFLATAACGLLIGARARWYLPTHRPAWWCGLVGAIGYGLFHLVPNHGSWPIGDLMLSMRADKLAFLGLAIHFGCVLTAAVISAVNVPSTPSFVAVARARRCFRLLVASIVAPVVFSVLSLIVSPFGDAGMVAVYLTSGAKYAVMFGGLMLLIPLGISELIVGKTSAD